MNEIRNGYQIASHAVCRKGSSQMCHLESQQLARRGWSFRCTVRRPYLWDLTFLRYTSWPTRCNRRCIAGAFGGLVAGALGRWSHWDPAFQGASPTSPPFLYTQSRPEIPWFSDTSLFCHEIQLFRCPLSRLLCLLPRFLLQCCALLLLVIFSFYWPLPCLFCLWQVRLLGWRQKCRYVCPFVSCFVADLAVCRSILTAADSVTFAFL